MARYLSTDLLIKDVVRRAMLPQTSNTFTKEDFLAFANEEIDIGVVPHILSFHEDYLMISEEIPLESHVSRYAIPHRAIGNKIRDVSYKDPSGTIFEMTRIFIEDEAYFQYGPLGAVNGPLKAFYTEGNEIVLMPDIDHSIYGTLKVSYYIRPNQLVSESDVARITSFDYKNGIINIDALPTVFSGETVFDITSSKSPHKLLGKDLVPNAQAGTVFTFGTQQIYTIGCVAPGSIIDSSYITLLDNTSANPITTHFWFDLTGTSTPPVVTGTLTRVDLSAAITATDVANALKIAIDAYSPTYIKTSLGGSVLTINNAGASVSVGPNFTLSDNTTGNTLTLIQTGTNTMPRGLNNTDVFALAEQTIIPQIPVELHSMLTQRVAIRCLEALGDQAGLQAGMIKLAEMELKTGSLIDNRVEGASLKVAPKHTFLRSSRNYLRR